MNYNFQKFVSAFSLRNIIYLNAKCLNIKSVHFYYQFIFDELTTKVKYNINKYKYNPALKFICFQVFYAQDYNQV